MGTPRGVGDWSPATEAVFGPLRLAHTLMHTTLMCPTVSLKGQGSIWPHTECGQRRVGLLSLVSVAWGPAPSLAEAWITKATAY